MHAFRRGGASGRCASPQAGVEEAADGEIANVDLGTRWVGQTFAAGVARPDRSADAHKPGAARDSAGHAPGAALARDAATRDGDGRGDVRVGARRWCDRTDAAPSRACRGGRRRGAAGPVASTKTRLAHPDAVFRRTREHGSARGRPPHRRSGGVASARSIATASSSVSASCAWLPSRRSATLRSSASRLPTTSSTGTFATECSRTL